MNNSIWRSFRPIMDCKDEFPLLYDADKFNERVKLWDNYLRVFCYIKKGKNLYKEEIAWSCEYGSDRLEFLWKHLDVINDRCATLLQFMSLLAILIGVVCKELYPSSVLIIFFWVFWAASIVSALNCLLQLSWGKTTEMVDKSYIEAEQEELDNWIPEVIYRSAYYRIAALGAWLSVISLVLATILIFIT
ncbi:hypothetical protein KDD30_07765 [Photobacterium sp. GJ3]|uniref:hypothetical protein n=1 Tax=Photobacterium sp. GJ3 TaxID=2829502 RepID=UPI001B8B39F8|nr:hypothetical protein [Photobacterium sp. GJ3]QUJ68953.1 hypothetical protein KDD30_07765 [Photobacterium sp. GJ3]